MKSLYFSCVESGIAEMARKSTSSSTFEKFIVKHKYCITLHFPMVFPLGKDKGILHEGENNSKAIGKSPRRRIQADIQLDILVYGELLGSEENIICRESMQEQESEREYYREHKEKRKCPAENFI